MDSHSLLNALIDLAETLGIATRRVSRAGEGPGGALVRLKGRELLMLDPASPLADQIAVVAAALKGRPSLDDRFLPPEVRQVIETAGAE